MGVNVNTVETQHHPLVRSVARPSLENCRVGLVLHERQWDKESIKILTILSNVQIIAYSGLDLN